MILFSHLSGEARENRSEQMESIPLPPSLESRPSQKQDVECSTQSDDIPNVQSVGVPVEADDGRVLPLQFGL